MFTYAPLWVTLEKRGISQYQLIKEYRFSTGTLDALRKNKSVTIYTIDRLCQILHCKPNDIIEIIQEEG